jgi:ATP-dependent protease ClpP protease subunit
MEFLMWPQITLIVLAAMSFATHLAKAGEPTNRNYSPGLMIIIIAIEFGLMYAGGFFDVFLK